jgi:protein-tyrosine phosphatase
MYFHDQAVRREPLNPGGRVDAPGAPGDHSGRVVDVPGVRNLRDLGGLPIAGGGRTASGRLFRSEFAIFAAEPGKPPANPLHLRTVVDLRRHSETRHERVEWASVGVTYVHTPLALAGGDTFSEGYGHYVTGKSAVFADAIRTLADPANHPALFHCAAGKDRTGVVAAFLLELLGVERQQIVEDYVLTERTLEHVLARMAGEEPYRESITSSTVDELRPRSTTILGFLDWLDTDHGGAREWALSNGMTAAEISAFRAAMIEPA